MVNLWGHGNPRHLAKHDSGCIWMRVTSESVHSVTTILLPSGWAVSNQVKDGPNSSEG